MLVQRPNMTTADYLPLSWSLLWIWRQWHISLYGLLFWLTAVKTLTYRFFFWFSWISWFQFCYWNRLLFLVNSLKETERESEKKEKYKKDYEGTLGPIVSRTLAKYKSSLVGNFHHSLLVLATIKLEHGSKEKVNTRQKVYYWSFLLNRNVLFHGLESRAKHLKRLLDVLHFGKDAF